VAIDATTRWVSNSGQAADDTFGKLFGKRADETADGHFSRNIVHHTPDHPRQMRRFEIRIRPYPP